MDQLRWLRKQRGWSQADLARESKVDRVTINQLESGSRRPHIATLEKLASAFEVGIGEFFDPPALQKDWVLAQGVDLSDAELEVANRTIANLWRLSLGERADAYFVPDEVDSERVLMIIAYARSLLGDLNWSSLERTRELLADGETGRQ